MRTILFWGEKIGKNVFMDVHASDLLILSLSLLQSPLKVFLSQQNIGGSQKRLLFSCVHVI